ncbi:hypothetical protein EDC01DRAFT_28522 [Geopyxis carbonaria]|nr:hypothetical protein EDC01DRAFT_28522 [Geopyxis carbonaria]
MSARSLIALVSALLFSSCTPHDHTFICNSWFSMRLSSIELAGGGRCYTIPHYRPGSYIAQLFTVGAVPPIAASPRVVDTARPSMAFRLITVIFVIVVYRLQLPLQCWNCQFCIIRFGLVD